VVPPEKSQTAESSRWVRTVAKPSATVRESSSNDGADRQQREALARAADRLGPGAGETAVDDGDPRRQVVGEAGDRLGAELRVEHHHHGAVLERAEQGADELGAVRQRQEDPLLAPQAETGEDVGEAVGQPLDLAVGELAVGQPQRDALAAPLGDALVEQPGREVELLGRNEGHLSSGVGADSTGAPSGIMRG